MSEGLVVAVLLLTALISMAFIGGFLVGWRLCAVVAQQRIREAANAQGIDVEFVKGWRP